MSAYLKRLRKAEGYLPRFQERIHTAVQYAMTKHEDGLDRMDWMSTVIMHIHVMWVAVLRRDIRYRRIY